MLHTSRLPEPRHLATRPDRVLFGIDPCFRERAAILYGLELCRYLGSELVFFHAVDQRDASAVGETDPTLNVSPSLGECNFASSITMRGQPAQSIVQHAGVIQAGLILMGARDRSSWFGSPIGSTASTVIRDTNCPVLLFGQTVEPQREFGVKHIVCGVAFNRYTAALVSYTMKLAALFAARLTFVHIVPEVSEALMVHDLGGNSEIVLDPDKARQRVAMLVKPLTQSVVPEIQVLSGHVESTLSKYTRRHVADLAVIGHSAGGPQYLLEKLVAGSRFPVLSVPQRTTSLPDLSSRADMVEVRGEFKAQRAAGVRRTWLPSFRAQMPA